MRRVIQFLEWRHDWWEKRAYMRTVSDAGLADGLQAYAHEQAHLQYSLSESFLDIWKGFMDKETDVVMGTEGDASEEEEGEDDEEDRGDEENNDRGEDSDENDDEGGEDEDDNDL